MLYDQKTAMDLLYNHKSILHFTLHSNASVQVLKIQRLILLQYFIVFSWLQYNTFSFLCSTVSLRMKSSVWWNWTLMVSFQWYDCSLYGLKWYVYLRFSHTNPCLIHFKSAPWFDSVESDAALNLVPYYQNQLLL